MSFRRMMWPYFLSAFIIATFTFVLTNFVIPKSNLIRMDFEDKYYHSSNKRIMVENIHRQVSKDILVYMGNFNPISQRGQNFTIEKIDSGKLVSKLSAASVTYDTTKRKWTAFNYVIRNIKRNGDILIKGKQIDTTLNKIQPDDFSRDPSFVGTMTSRELDNYIKLLKLLTLIGVSLSSRKIRGGIGMNIGIGLGLSFSYILFLQFASQFCLKGNLGPMLAMWIPNIIYFVIGLVLYKMAPK
jgi:lipopolysaccharide export system permease protein